MKWEEVRRLYPNQYVKLTIIDSHKKGERKMVTDVAFMYTIDDPKTATKELLQAKGDTIVYHTGNEDIVIEVREPIGNRGIRL